MDPKDRLIAALDVDSKKKAMALVECLKKDVRFFKVGLELYSSCGPNIVKSVKEAGCEVFLDLKFHDIPNTAAKAAASVTGLGVFMLNVHALGGYDMMRKTMEAVSAKADSMNITRPKVLAVTILTSADQNSLKKTGIDDNIDREVLRLADLARSAGLDGVVASPAEAKAIREKFGSDFLIVTPGVRPSWSASNDQKRIASPKEAVAMGADFIVVGRPVIEATEPALAARRILKEIQNQA